MYVRANQDSFRTDEDQIFFMLSHMNKGSAAEMARLYIADAANKIDGKTAEEFVNKLNDIYGDKAEKSRAMNKLDHMKQGSRSLHEFITDFELTLGQADYNDAKFHPLICHMFLTKVNSRLADRLYDAGAPKDDYYKLRDQAAQIEASLQQRDYERRAYHGHGQNTGRSSNTSQTKASNSQEIKTSTGTTFTGQGQAMDIGQARAQGLCFNCHQKGHLSRNCPQKRQYQVRQMIGQLSDADRAALIREYSGAKVEEVTTVNAVTAQTGFQAPQQ